MIKKTISKIRVYTKQVFLIGQLAAMSAFILISAPLAGQESLTYDDPEQAYKKGLEMFEFKNYVEAKRLFQQTIDRPMRAPENENQTYVTNAKVYAAFCAFELHQPDAGKLLEEAIKLIYGEPPLKRYAYYYMGKYYFREKEYANAIEYFEKTDKKHLSSDDLAEYKFQLAYCYFYKKRLDEAEKLFKEIRNIKNKYYYPSNYYYGYIAFQKRELDVAMESFQRIKDSKVYEKIIPYYISQVYYFKKQYDDLIKYLHPLISDSGLKYYAELNQILGQAYFEQGKYDKAIRHLTIYITESGKARKEDIYQLGYAYYKAGDYKEAIIQLEQLDNQSDTLGQNAVYVLGDCYMKVGKKSNARSAFGKASQMDFDPAISEIALFNYAKLSYELGYETEAIKSFQKYIDQYDSGENAEEAKELLTELFLNTRNYKEALRVIESVKNPSPKVKQAYQEVAYNRGIEFYNDREFDEAIAQFNKSLQNPVNAPIKALSYYWKGESYYAKNEYSSAAEHYLQFIDLAKITTFADGDWYIANAYYGAGYSLLKQNKYGNALPSFNECIAKCKTATDKNLKDKILPDAQLRAADCSFMVRDYNGALANYSQIIDGKKSGADYASFQKGMILGLQGKMDGKAAIMETFETKYPGSIYLDDAIYEAGTAYISLGKDQTAIQLFKKIPEKFPNSSYVAKSYLKLGLVYYNQNDVTAAMDSYKKVISKYPNSEDAQQALLAIKQISIAEGDPKLYMNVVNSSPNLRVSASEKDSISYLAAESQFISGKCDQAISSFSDYISEFKDGYFLLNARFYRGECYYSAKQFQPALADYKYVIDAGKNIYFEKALAKASFVSFNNNSYQEAFGYYKLLLENAAFKENVYAANLGLMRCSYHLQRMPELKEYATTVLSSSDAPADNKIEAEFYLGKVAFAEKDYDQAVKFFKKTADMTTTQIGSEAKYLVAEISFIKGIYQQSLDECLAFVELKPTHEYWRVKGFILLAQNYHKLNNTFQAKATLQSIIDHYKSDDDLKSIAQSKLNEILEDEKAKQKIEIISDTGSTLEEDTTEQIELVVPVEVDTLKED